ncbi:MAG: HlyD family secretion protein, partial [Salinivirgaceae bacterium]|nr:HlyD family secretion protein [Salinivirgaceae bacterium]
MKPIYTIITIACITMLACQNGQTDDASGTFEAVETIISAEMAGKINQLNIEEGEVIEANTVVGYIDSTQIYLKMKQIEAQIEAVESRKPDIDVQIAPLIKQLQTAENEKIRVENLMKANAATGKQLDDVTAQIEFLQKQIAAQRSMLTNQSKSIEKELIPLQVQNEQLADQLQKCTIRNPISGTVLSKYAEQFEQTAPGKPLYKIADLSNMILRA